MPYRHQANLIAIAIALSLQGTPATAQPWSALETKPSSGQVNKSPTISVQCLPPGGTKPKPCASANAGSTVELISSGGDPLPPNTVLLPFVAPWTPNFGRTTEPLSSLASNPTVLQFTLPREWCEGHAGTRKILIIDAGISPAPPVGGDAASVGWFQMQC